MLSNYLKLYFVEQYFTEWVPHRALALAIQGALGGKKKKGVPGQVPYPLTSCWSITSTLAYLRLGEVLHKETYLSFVKLVVPIFICGKLSMQNAHGYLVELTSSGYTLNTLPKSWGSCQGNTRLHIVHSLPQGT